ncbi:hypothetical protein [Kocuria oceani]|uniref:Uncharacterized protein n=1 Tax=Kocuria oceani TaxID=988827 RepID=A0ABV9TLP6_9MICC|nr:hypothetical protein [Kocuria oceani]
MVLEAPEHDALEGFTAVLMSFVLPLLVLILVGVSAYELGRRRALDRHAGAPWPGRPATA